MIVNLQRLFARWQLSANLVARSCHFFVKRLPAEWQKGYVSLQGHFPTVGVKHFNVDDDYERL
ncbi:MAG TPA: hypothetical protein V6C50_05900 [Crinalium sp.]